MTSSRTFKWALALSLLLHLALAGWWVGKPAVSLKETNKQAVVIDMRAFALNPPPATPLPEVAPTTATKAPSSVPKIEHKKVHIPTKQKTKKPQKQQKKTKEIAQVTEKNPTIFRQPEKTSANTLPDGTLDATSAEVWDNLLKNVEKNIPNVGKAQDLNHHAPIPENVRQIKVDRPYHTIAPASKPPFPHDALLRYQGPLSITGSMHFQRDEKTYRIETQFNIPFNKMEFISEGKIEENKLIPLKYTHKRKGKVYASAIFDYDTQTAHYGKGSVPNQQYAMNGRQLDYFSWAWQMSINGGIITEDVQLTNGKKVYFQPAITSGDVIGEKSELDTGEGKIRLVTLNIEREKTHKKDEISYGFAPDFANIPARVTFNDGKTQYELNIFGIELDGQKYWQAMRRVNRKDR